MKVSGTNPFWHSATNSCTTAGPSCVGQPRFFRCLPLRIREFLLRREEVFVVQHRGRRLLSRALRRLRGLLARRRLRGAGWFSPG
eukprot:3299273-Prymnesium_polylepis.3